MYVMICDAEESDSWDYLQDFAEERLQNLQKEVAAELQEKHPVLFEGHNLCALAKSGELGKSLKLNELKRACVKFELSIAGPKTKKYSYLQTLQDFLDINRSRACNFC